MQRAGWRLKWAGWSWVEVEMSRVEVDGVVWSWVEVGARFSNTQFNESVFWSWKIILNLFWKTCFTCFLLGDCTNTVVMTAFLFFSLFETVLMKTYSQWCGHRGDKKTLQEMKKCRVIASKWILFIKRFLLLSRKMNWVSCHPFPFYITNQSFNVFIENVLEFRQ